MKKNLNTKNKCTIDKEFDSLENAIKDFHLLEDMGSYSNNIGKERKEECGSIELHLKLRVHSYISKIESILNKYEKDEYLIQRLKNLLKTVIKVHKENETWGSDESADTNKLHNTFQYGLKYFETFFNELLGVELQENKTRKFKYRETDYEFLSCMQKIIVMHLLENAKKPLCSIESKHFSSQQDYFSTIAIFVRENPTNIEMNLNRVLGHINGAKEIKEDSKQRMVITDLIKVSNWFKMIGQENLAQVALNYLPEYEKIKLINIT